VEGDPAFRRLVHRDHEDAVARLEGVHQRVRLVVARERDLDAPEVRHALHVSGHGPQRDAEAGEFAGDEAADVPARSGDDDQKISGHHGAADARNAASARPMPPRAASSAAAAASCANEIPPRNAEPSPSTASRTSGRARVRRTSPSVDRPAADVLREVRVGRDLDGDPAGRVRPSGERRRNVDEPEPERIPDREPELVDAVDEERQRVVDRQVDTPRRGRSSRSRRGIARRRASRRRPRRTASPTRIVFVQSPASSLLDRR
jgi:hypothetical protein